MHCRSCNKILTDEEASLKYDGWEEIKNPEERYIELCNKCIRASDLAHYVTDEYIEEVDYDFLPSHELPELWEP